MLSINKETSGESQVVALGGRLDTTTAQELEGAIKEAIEGKTELIIDMKELEYISSAGLRVLLSAHKAMSRQGTMVVKNASEAVKEIFEVTGFSDILTIE